MRRIAYVALVVTLTALAPAARADDQDDLADADSEAGVSVRNHFGEPIFGLRMAVGGLHVGARNVPVFTDGLQAGFGLGLGFRGYAEAALLWTLGPADVAMDDHGFGARTELGLRHALATWKMFYLDAEAGGGVAFVGDSQLGNRTIPAGFVGLRTGYDLAGSTSNARFLEAAFDLRLYETPYGHNWIFGVTIGWGR